MSQTYTKCVDCECDIPCTLVIDGTSKNANVQESTYSLRCKLCNQYTCDKCLMGDLLFRGICNKCILEGKDNDPVIPDTSLPKQERHKLLKYEIAEIIQSMTTTFDMVD